MKHEVGLADLLRQIEGHRAEWIEKAPVDKALQVNRRTRSITIRLTAEEDDALDAAAQRLGVAKSTFVRVLLRNGLALSHGTHEAATIRFVKFGGMVRRDSLPRKHTEGVRRAQGTSRKKLGKA